MLKEKWERIDEKEAIVGDEYEFLAYKKEDYDYDIILKSFEYNQKWYKENK